MGSLGGALGWGGLHPSPTDGRWEGLKGPPPGAIFHPLSGECMYGRERYCTPIPYVQYLALFGQTFSLSPQTIQRTRRTGACSLHLIQWTEMWQTLGEWCTKVKNVEENTMQSSHYPIACRLFHLVIPLPIMINGEGVSVGPIAGTCDPIGDRNSLS